MNPQSKIQNQVMQPTPYLVFKSHDSLYAVRAAAIREILWLPELTPFEESPPYIAGVFNLRGKIIPVTDINIRFGHTPHRYNPKDVVIVVEMEDVLMGILVNEVREVKEISPTEIEGLPSYLQKRKPHHHFLEGEAKIGDNIIMLLDLNRVISPVEFTGEETAMKGAEPVLTRYPVFCPDATPEEMAIFRERAHNLKQQAADMESSKLIPLAVIGLSGEYFAVGLDFIHEFADVRNITPLPCCPKHIVGNMNLRGDILTIVDIRDVLKMSVRPLGSDAKVVVAEMQELVVGILAEEVLAVIHLRPSDITAVPLAVKSIDKEYLSGTAHYGERMLSILDLQKILTSERLVVNEEA